MAIYELSDSRNNAYVGTVNADNETEAKSQGERLYYRPRQYLTAKIRRLTSDLADWQTSSRRTRNSPRR